MIFPIHAIASSRELAMVAGVGVGFGFGFVLERAGFGNARKLAAQFYGTEMVMLKVMFTAIVTAILGVTIIDGIGALDLRALGDAVASPTFLWPMIAGGLLIGVGIILSGYCPGTSIVGIASGKLDAVVAYGGVMVGQLVWSELEFRAPFKAFHQSGNLGQYYLYDLLRVPPAVVAVAIVVVAFGAFLAGEAVERKLARAPAATSAPGRGRRFVWAGLGAFGVVAAATLAVPARSAAVPAAPATIAAAELARRVIDEPWKVRVLDVRAMEKCAAQRVPGAECTPPEALAGLYLGDVAPARDLVVVGEGEVAELPPEIRAYRGRVLALRGGFEGWRSYALASPEPPQPGAAPAELEAYRLRAGIHAAVTGAKAPPPPTAPAGGAPVKRKAGGGGCSG